MKVVSLPVKKGRLKGIFTNQDLKVNLIEIVNIFGFGFHFSRMDIPIKLRYRIFLICTAIAAKVGFVFFFAYYQPGADNINPQLFAVSGDFHDYIDPVENLINEGRYYFGDNNYAGRMPGYTMVLLPLRFFFGQENALIITVFLQAILSGISVFVLASVSFKFTSQRFVFWGVYLLYLFSTYVSIWDRFILTESFAGSSLIFSIYFFQRYLKKKKRIQLFVSGAFFAWTVFLRPFMAPVFLVFIWILFSEERYRITKKMILSGIVFAFIFLVSDGLWVFRNYQLSGRFIPLQSTTAKGGQTSPENRALNQFIKSFGGDRIYWHPGSEAMWFATDDYLAEKGFSRPSDDVFPDWIFYEDLTLDTLKKARDYLHRAMVEESHFFKEEYLAEAARILNHFRDRNKENHWFRSTLGSRLQILSRFLVTQPFTYYFPYSFQEAGVFGKTLKMGNLLLNLFAVWGGLMGTILLLWQKTKDKRESSLFIGIPLFIIFLFPVWFQTNEYRFLVLAFPFLLLNSTITFNYLICIIKKIALRNFGYYNNT